MQCPNCGATIAENTLQALETPAAPTVPPSPSEEDISLKDMFLMDLVARVPLVGPIMCIIWAAQRKDKARANWALARLIGAVAVLLFVVLLEYFSMKAILD